MNKSKKNIIYIILIVVGLIPFIVPIVWAISSAIKGDSLGMCVLDCEISYGLSVFFDFLLWYSIVFWPTYVIGIALIIVSIQKLLINKNNKSNITEK